MAYNLLTNGVYWGYNPLTNLLLSSWDIQVDSSVRFQADVSELSPCAMEEAVLRSRGERISEAINHMSPCGCFQK